jgi:tetratricopeptide (TPR) repeat protein
MVALNPGKAEMNMKKITFLLLILAAPALVFSLAVSDKTVNQYLDQAEGVMQNGSYKYAKDLYDVVLKIDQNNVSALMGKGSASKMLGDDAAGDTYYDKAHKLDPNAVIPDLWKYKEKDRLRSDKNKDDIRKAYHDMFDKKPAAGDLNIGGVPLPTGGVEITGVGVTTAAKGLEKPVARDTTEEDKKKMLADREWQIRGGNAKMLSLGGIKFVYPDMSTAMDGASFGIDTGFMFRRKQHVFSLNPYAGYYYKDNVQAVTGYPDKMHSLFVTENNSLGDVGMPNDYFMTDVKPVFQNSFLYKESQWNPLPEMNDRLTNEGTDVGGQFILGIKPIQYFAMAGGASYQYIPYNEVILDNSSSNSINAMGQSTYTKLDWRAGMGFCIPTVFTNMDQLDLTTMFGTYSPDPDYSDLKNGFLTRLPYSLFQGYTMTVSKSNYWVDQNRQPYIGTDTHEDIFQSDGYVIKTNLHYMYGNALHEFFAYLETPIGLKYTEQTKITTKDTATGGILYNHETDSPLTDVGSANAFIFKTGIRDDFNYIGIGIRYEVENENYYLNTTRFASDLSQFMPSDLQRNEEILPYVPDFKSIGMTPDMRMYDYNYKIISGINIKPVWAFDIPIEFEYDAMNISGTYTGDFLMLDKIIRAGLELKPIPFFAVRGGLSYETISFLSPILAEPGSASNPYNCIVGYHFGTGFDLPIFEFNAGGAYKRVFSSPTSSSYSSSERYYLEGYLDINIYI